MTDREIAQLITASVGYRLTVGPIDKAKVTAEFAGDLRPYPGARLAQAAVELARRANSSPAPEPPSLAQLGRNVMFTAWAPEAALRCPTHWKVAVSADPAYDQAVRAAAPRIRANGNPLFVWGVQTQTGVERITRLAAELHADAIIYQAETPAEYDSAIAAGAQLIVGNPNAWTAAQRADATRRGDTLATLFEVYTNQGAPWPETASTQGVPVTSEVLGVGWGASPYQLAHYKPHTPPAVWAGISVYLAENMSTDSWALLP